MGKRMHAAVAVALLAATAGCGQKVASTAPSVRASVALTEPADLRRGSDEKVDAQRPRQRVREDPARRPRTVAVEAEPAPAPAQPADPAPAAQQQPADDPPRPQDPPEEAFPTEERKQQVADPGRPLENTGWTSVRVTQDGKPRPLIDGTRIELAFEQRSSTDVIRWRSGCNSAGAELSITARRLLLEPAMGTDVYCSDEHSEQDVWVSEFFSRDPAWELDDDRVRLDAGDTVMVFQRAKYW